MRTSGGKASASSKSASVFIIESLDFEDETEGWYEGKILQSILSMSRKKAEYTYIRTDKELCAVLKHFQRSGLKYLHISCHGDKKSFGLALDSLSFRQVADRLAPYMDGKRLFASACEVVNETFAKEIFERTGCLSVIGPSATHNFDDLALMWATFYHLMFRRDRHRMKGSDIKEVIKTIERTFDIRFSYFHRAQFKT
jgi:hypothetical protein